MYANHGQPDVAEAALCHNLLEYGELFLFLFLFLFLLLLLAMTYINVLKER